MGHSSTPLSSTINLINNVVGAGLFSMPWCLAQSTVVTGSLIFLLVCVLNVVSFALLAHCCTQTQCFSYLEIGRSALGRRFGIAAQLTSMLYACGSLVSYVVLANNFLLGEGTGVLALALPKVFGSGGLGARLAVGFAFSTIGFLPLCLLRTLDSLKLSSWAALVATLYAGFICVFELAASPDGSLTPDEEATGRQALRASVVYAGVPVGLWAAVPIVNVAFTAHYNAPRYYQELERRSVRRYVAVASASLLVALFVYLSVGVSGYLSFGSMTSGDVLENFNDKYPLAVGARIALLIVLVSCYPKVQHSVRDGLIRMTTSDYTTDTLPLRTFVGYTLGVVGVSTLVGTLVEKVEVVLAYKGGIFGSLMVYVWPALMHAALAEQAHSAGGKHVQGGAAVPAVRPSDAPAVVGGGSTSTLDAAPTTQQHLLQASLLDVPAVLSDDAAAVGPPEHTPLPLGSVLCAMLTTRRHVGPALLLIWGVVSGLLGVGVTIHKQATEGA